MSCSRLPLPWRSGWCFCGTSEIEKNNNSWGGLLFRLSLALYLSCTHVVSLVREEHHVSTGHDVSSEGRTCPRWLIAPPTRHVLDASASDPGQSLEVNLWRISLRNELSESFYSETFNLLPLSLQLKHLKIWDISAHWSHYHLKHILLLLKICWWFENNA